MHHFHLQLELAIEAGCEGDVTLEAPDTEVRGDSEDVKCVAFTEVEELGKLQAALQEKGHACSGMLVYVPSTTIACSEEDSEANYKYIDMLDEIDDVSSVEHNMQV
jgi:transcriptional/translational regulatory protein YebC/TACO1